MARLRKLNIVKEKYEQLITKNLNEESKEKIFLPIMGFN